MKILLVGMNHRTAPVEVRECFAVRDPKPLLAKLVDGTEISEAVLLSTCNRVEVIATTRNRDAALHRLRHFFCRDLVRDLVLPRGERVEDYLYECEDAEATLHLFRVASSIDSLVVGEPQILGQVKSAYRAAVEARACQSVLNRLFHRAFETAKRVRRETRIAERPISVARVAVDLADQVFETFEDKAALLIGAGEMSEMALDALRSRGLREVHVASRTLEHATEVAQRFGATAHVLSEIPALFEKSDIVLTCLGVSEPVLDVPLVHDALRAKSRRPVFIVDLGVPRNVDPQLNEYEGVYLYDIDDLGSVAERNSERRREQTKRAEAIVVQEQQRFDGWFTALQAVPTIRDLRERAEAIRRSELKRAAAKLQLTPAQQEGVELLTRSILNKVLHEPVSRLRREAETEEGLGNLEMARKLFGLDESKKCNAAQRADVLPEDGEDE